MHRTSEIRPPPRIVVDGRAQDFTLRHTHSFKETFVASLRRKPAHDHVPRAGRHRRSPSTRARPSHCSATTAPASRRLLKLDLGRAATRSGRVLTRGRVAGLIEVGAGFHPDLSGRENVYLNAAILGMTKKEIERAFDEIVAFSEIGEFIDTEVKHYSSGMFLRLAFSVAIHTELDILLVDEMLAVGDEPFRRSASRGSGSSCRGQDAVRRLARPRTWCRTSASAASCCKAARSPSTATARRRSRSCAADSLFG